MVDQLQKHEIKANVEETLPPGSSGIIAVLEERWVTDVQNTLAKAEKAERHHVHE